MRRPARLERAGALGPRDRIWSAVRRFGTDGAFFSVAEIMVLADQRADTVLAYLTGLSKSPEQYLVPVVERQRRPGRECTRFAFSNDVGAHAPRVDADGKPVTQGIGREQMWRALRKFKGDFTWRELVQCCTHPVAMYEAKDYLKHLNRAGYLQIVTAARPTVAARYQFNRARDTGPRAPAISRDKSVMDGNTGEIVLQRGRK